MSAKLFDPTLPQQGAAIAYVPRPRSLNKLRVGLVDNRKPNADVILLKLAQRLKQKFGMELVGLHAKKSYSHGVDAAAIREFKTKADFVIAGVGD